MSDLITICSIFKNEESFIPEFIDCFLPFTNSFHVLDTGSTDKSVSLFQSRGIQPGFFEWCNDFGKARTASLQNVKTPWVLVVDMDDRIHPETMEEILQVLPELPHKTGSLALKYRNMQSMDWKGLPDNYVNEQMRCMFFRSSFPLEYRGAIHEDPVPSIVEAQLEIQNLDYVAYHLGYVGELMEKKGERNRQYLIREFESGGRSPRTLYYMSSILEQDEPLKARECIEAGLRNASGELERKLLQRALLFSHDHPSKPLKELHSYCERLKMIDCNDPILALFEARQAFAGQDPSSVLSKYQNLESRVNELILKPFHQEIHYRVSFCLAALGKLELAYEKMEDWEKFFLLSALAFHLRLKLALAIGNEDLIFHQLGKLPETLAGIGNQKLLELEQIEKALGERADGLRKLLKEYEQ